MVAWWGVIEDVGVEVVVVLGVEGFVGEAVAWEVEGGEVVDGDVVGGGFRRGGREITTVHWKEAAWPAVFAVFLGVVACVIFFGGRV